MSETTLPTARTLPPPFRTLAIVLLLAALAVALVSAAYIASRPSAPLPAPFGPAANGLIPYVSAGDIYVGDPISGTSRLLVDTPEDVALPQFSPDGTRVALLRSVDPGPNLGPVDVYVLQADGSGLMRITSAPIAQWQWVAWTPDGRHLAVIHTVEGVNQLDLFDASGSGSVETIATAAGMDFIQFRPPDGREILYRALVDGKWGLFAMDADGTNPRPIVEPSVPTDMGLAFTDAVYSGDGSRIFYNHGDASGCCRLWVVNADGTDDREFLPLGPAWDGQAVVSPDGARIAYWHHSNDQPSQRVSVVRADGSGPVIETGPVLPDTARWVWAPDSSRILMYPNDGVNAKAYLLDPEGGPWTTVPWSSDSDLDWQRVAAAP